MLRHAPLLAGLAAVLVTAPAAASPPSPIDLPAEPSQAELAKTIETTTDPNGNILTFHEGPGMVCGRGFAIDLGIEEKLKVLDPQMDFRTYTLSSEQGSMVMYEGNYPQPAEAYVPTGLDYPGVIALHENPERPGYAAEDVAPRLIVSAAFQAACTQVPAG